MKRSSHSRSLALLAALALSLAAAGCDSEKNPYDPEKPLDKMTKDEWCNFYSYYLTNPNISAATRQSAMKQMRDRNCPSHG